MFGLDAVDLFTLVIYLLGITLLGIWMGRTVHNTTDYFVGGRRFGRLFSTFHTFGTGTHSDQAVSVAAKTYTSGMSGIWYQWLWLFVTPFFWWVAPLMRRCRAITGADFFEARFGRSVAMLFVAVGILNMMVNLGTMLKGSGAVIRATTDGHINEDLAIAAMTVMFVTYGVVGGLSAAVVTDFIQGLLTIVFSFVLLPFAIHELGGFSGLHEGVARTVEAVGQANPAANVPDASDMWSLVAPGEIGLFYIIVIALNALVGSVTQPITMPMCNAVKTERAVQFGYVAGVLIKRLCTVAWTLLGMCAFVMFSGMTEDEDIDQAFGLVAHKLLPEIMPGLIGIFIASLLASIMSSCDSVMVACSALFTQNLYRPLIAPDKGQRHYVNVGRVAAVVTVAGGVLYAYKIESVIEGLEMFWKISAMMGIVFWAGLFWRRATTMAAWASTLAAFGVLYVTSQAWFVDWARVHATWLLFTPDAEEIYLPTAMVIYLSAGTFVMVIVSLFTRPPAKADLDRFYDTVRTPVRPGETVVRPFQLPNDVLPASQRKLIDHPDWEIQRPTARGVIGFIVCSAAVATLIGAVILLVQIGA